MNTSISRENLFNWCSIPVGELGRRTDLKTKLLLKKDRVETMRTIGNLMADEVKQNNATGKITKWVLPAGPMDEYDTFIDRVNTEKISCKNLYIFHMDEFLDWECRLYPVGDTYESLEGTMNAGFYDRIDPQLTVPLAQRFWPRISDLDFIDDKIASLGGVDTVWAGVGARGMVAFCEAPHPWLRISLEEFANSKTRIVDIGKDTMVALSQRSFGACYERVPAKAVTIGFKAMLNAKRAVLMITTGAWKQTIVRIVLFSEPTVEFPVTLFHKYIPEVILACDYNTADHPMSHPIRGW